MSALESVGAKYRVLSNRLDEATLREWAAAAAVGKPTGAGVRVCHFLPGTSKWKKIGHRLCCHIARNWQGRPRLTRVVVVKLNGHVRTAQGLCAKAALDVNAYAAAIKIVMPNWLAL